MALVLRKLQKQLLRGGLVESLVELVLVDVQQRAAS
jgi:hypothetical protein